MSACQIHLAGACAVHDHSQSCPDCGTPQHHPCDTSASRYAPWCCPACWHEQNTNEGA